MPLIPVCMKEHVLIWITTHSSVCVREAGKDSTVKVSVAMSVCLLTRRCGSV